MGFVEAFVLTFVIVGAVGGTTAGLAAAGASLSEPGFPMPAAERTEEVPQPSFFGIQEKQSDIGE